MRIDKFISNNTHHSRKTVNKLIRSKQVELNGSIISDGSIKINDSDLIRVCGELINDFKFYYLVLNKPIGYICSNSNKDGNSIINLIDPKYQKIHIVGRLDKDTSGLILLTNDGEFTHKIKKPTNSIEKEYIVETKENITNEMIEKINNIKSLDNKELKPFTIKKVNETSLRIILTEGRYHQIKRMVYISGNKVKYLSRIRIGKLKIEKLNLIAGEYREINPSDIFD